MHQPIKERLEEYLGGMEDSIAEQEIEDHLASCPQCRRAVNAMRRQAEFIQGLRPAGEAEPSPGFYARVLDRIELQRVPSIWELFLEPVFGRRLVYASVTLALILGTLVVTSGTRPTATPAYSNYYSPEAILAAEPVSQYMGDDIEHDRSVVFVNLATYRY
jgi:predicted anti-sigma-YlaC factor YlaD